MSLNHYEKQIYQLLSEADKFYARDPDGKKISVFTDKDNYDKAVKGGYDAVDAAEAEAELSGQTGEKPAEKPEPKVTAIAADPFADKGGEEPSGEPEGGDPLDANGWYTERADKNETWAHIGGIEPRSRTMSRDEMEASGIPMRELEQNYDPIPKDAGDAVVDSYEGYNQKSGRVVQMVVVRFEDGTTYHMETELHHHGTNAAWPDGEEYYDGRMKKLNFRSTRPKDYESRGMAPTESGIHKSRAIQQAFGTEPRHGDDYLTRPDEKQESVIPWKSQYNRLFESLGGI